MDEIQIFSSPFILDFDKLLKSLNMPSNSDPEDLKALREMADQAFMLARPKAMYRIVSAKADEEGVAVGGKRLNGRLFGTLFYHSRIAVPYVATCGSEVEAWSLRFTEPLEHYWADGIKKVLLKAVRKGLTEHLRRAVFFGGDVSTVNPGSLPDWTLQGQQTVFALLNDRTAEIGVTLTDSFLMLPTKSSSGIAFSAVEHFENCALCPRENCPGRRAAQKVQGFDTGL